MGQQRRRDLICEFLKVNGESSTLEVQEYLNTHYKSKISSNTVGQLLRDKRIVQTGTIDECINTFRHRCCLWALKEIPSTQEPTECSKCRRKLMRDSGRNPTRTMCYTCLRVARESVEANIPAVVE